MREKESIMLKRIYLGYVKVDLHVASIRSGQLDKKARQS